MMVGFGVVIFVVCVCDGFGDRGLVLWWWLRWLNIIVGLCGVGHAWFGFRYRS